MTTPHTTAAPPTTTRSTRRSTTRRSTTRRSTTTTTTKRTTAAPVEYDYQYYDFSGSNAVDSAHHTGHSFSHQDDQGHGDDSDHLGNSLDYSNHLGNSLDDSDHLGNSLDYSYTEYSEDESDVSEDEQGINTLTGCPGLSG